MKDRIEEYLSRADEKYKELGKLYYEACSKKKPNPEKAKSVIQEIDQIHKQIKLLREEKKLADEGKKLCRSCNSTVPIESVFCNMCGAKFSDMKKTVTTKIEEIENAEAYQETEEDISETTGDVEEIKIRYCPNCNEPLDDDSVFCEYCGTRV